jgi:Cu2+-exporting ATPase
VGDGSQADSGRPWLAPLLHEADQRRPPHQEAITLELDIQGMHCAACVWLLQRLFSEKAGGQRLDINPGMGRLALTFDPAHFELDSFLNEIGLFGYRSGPPRRRPEGGGDDLLMRFGITAALAMNTMILSLAIYFGLSPQSDPGLYTTFIWAGAALATVAVWVGGQVFFRGALFALRRGILHLDLPIALGILLAWAGSLVSVFVSQGQAAYFDTLTIFIALVLLGRFVQTRVIERNRRLLLDEVGADDLWVRVVDGAGKIKHQPAHDLQTGDHVLLPRGALNLTRGRLLDHPGEFSLAWITGEPERIPFSPGDEVPAGAQQQSDGPRVVACAERFDRSSLHRILSPAQVGSEALSQKIWSRFAQVYVAGVIALASLGALFWWSAGLTQVVDVVVAVLVVTCPCAIGLATPLAVEMAQTRLRQRGLFVRRGSFFDRAAQIKKVVFDKTGTLTLGRPRLYNVEELNRLDAPTLGVLQHLVGGSDHPKSQALFAALKGRDATGAVHGEKNPVIEAPGLGLSWTDCQGQTFKLGRPDFALTPGPSSTDEAMDGALILAKNGQRLAAFRFEEDLHHDTLKEVRSLQQSGIQVHLCSGDAPKRVDLLAQRLGIPRHRARGGLSPEDKVAMIQDLDQGDALMVGDGLNDALALDAATASATPAGAASQLGGRVDFFFLGTGVGRIHDALGISRHLHRVALGNLALAALYNLGAVSLALSGLMTPLICAVAMPLSSLGVVGLTVWRLHRWQSPSVVTAAPPGQLDLVEVGL